jgi:hypothetical protein
MSFESRSDPKRRDKKKKTHFVSWKSFFFHCYFFIITFPLHFKKWNLELEVAL